MKKISISVITVVFLFVACMVLGEDMSESVEINEEQVINVEFEDLDKFKLDTFLAISFFCIISLILVYDVLP